MRLFRRDRNAKERVQDLKARVESLRKAGDKSRAVTLDDFLGGDDVITARIPIITPQSDPPADNQDPGVEPPTTVAPHSSFGAASARDEAFAFESGQDGYAEEQLPPVSDAAQAPHLSPEEEEALAAELQRYIQRTATEDSAAATGDRNSDAEWPSESWTHERPEEPAAFDWPKPQANLDTSAAPSHIDPLEAAMQQFLREQQGGGRAAEEDASIDDDW